jgi:hypothetical protein
MAAAGEQHGSAKLDEIQVRKIRALAKLGFTHRKLAHLYGVTHSVIGAIVRRETWRHLAEDEPSGGE